MTYIDLLYTHIHKEVRHDLGYNAGTYDAAKMIFSKTDGKIAATHLPTAPRDLVGCMLSDWAKKH